MANQNTSLKDKQALAHDLFMRTDKTHKEIAQIVKVGADTIGDWVKKGNWKVIKSANSITRAQAIAEQLMQIKAIDDEIRAKQKGMPNPKQTDMKVKLKDIVRDLDKSINLPDYITVCEELLRYANDAQPAQAKHLADLIKEFVHHKASQLTA